MQKGHEDLATIAEIMLSKAIELTIEKERLKRKNKKLRKKLRKASKTAKA